MISIDYEESGDVPTVIIWEDDEEGLLRVMSWLIDHQITALEWQTDIEIDKESVADVLRRKGSVYRGYPFFVMRMNRTDAIKLKLAL